jgi:hypothetical protein
MKVYHYDEKTGELLGDGDARPDPMEPGRWLIPAFATTVAPPEAQEGKMRCFDGSAWVYREF